MLRSPTRALLKAGVSVLALSVWAAAQCADEQPFDIPAGMAGDTVRIWSDQSGLQTLFDWNVGAEIPTRAVHGTFSPLDALGAMLRGTVLTFEIASSAAVAILRGSQYCRPESGAAAPLPPCVQPRGGRSL